VLVLNDVASNFLFRNEGSGKFAEFGLVSGFACNAMGDELGSMGIDCGDYDNDGWLDLHMTSYQNELPVLYRNLGNGIFEDVTLRTGAGDGCFPYVNWGTGLVDLDNDGHRDLFIACGHLQDNVESVDRTTAYKVRNVLLRNTGQGVFENVSHLAGDGLHAQRSSRGTGFDDLDGDGRLDVVILNSRDPPNVLRNASPGQHHWLQITLRGRKANRDGVGSRVQVVAGDLMLVDEVHSGRGYQSHWGSRLQFGLGQHASVDRIEIQWLGGGRQRLEKVAADQRLTIVEDQTPLAAF
jgi:enediyne biosynthesis protein E4